MTTQNITVREVAYDKGDAQIVRAQVFQQEQGIAKELDNDRRDDDALHFVAYDGAIPVVTMRVRFPQSQSKAKVERVAVIAHYRGRGVGQQIMEYAESVLKKRAVEHVYMNSQQSAQSFYEKLGYTVEGDIFYEASISHVKMTKSL